ncbi:glycosyl transferase family 2 [Neobacillus sp. LXY-1]|uniref:glycosyl transferase family 2 n=1 Tax=Neobacillus sp. LXY-1 TaxID=3379133 RepID=UPI003EE2BED4
MEQYQKVIVPFEKLTETIIPLNEPIILSVEKNEVMFEFLLKRKEGKENMIIFGSGAYDSTKFTPPVFQRHSWMDHFEESVIYFNDPTLYLGKINIGWGFGNADRHYLKEISEILKIILELCHIQHKDVLFYGSSAGGFMSLLLAGFIKESKALVNNPQTMVHHYYTGHVNKLFTNAMPEFTRDDIIKQYPARLNVLEFYKTIKYVPEIYYLQNLACEHDMEKHLTPFFMGLKELNESYDYKRIQLNLYYDKERDHNPLDMDETVSYIQQFIHS